MFGSYVSYIIWILSIYNISILPKIITTLLPVFELRIRVVNPRLDKSGRAGPGRSGPNFSWAGPFFAKVPRRFHRYSAIFF